MSTEVEQGEIGQRCMVESAVEIISTACQTTVTVKDAACNGTEEAPPGVVATVSLVGEVEWIIFLAIPAKTSAELASSLAGFRIEYENADLADAIGEVANIFVGDLKTRLWNKARIKADISLPCVLKGQDIDLLTPNGQLMAQVGFTCAQGGFTAGIISAGARRA